MGRLYIAVIQGSLYESHRHPPVASLVVDFNAEDWRRARDEARDEYQNHNLVIHLLARERWEHLMDRHIMVVKPEDMKCVEDKGGLLLYGKPKGAFQDAVARYLAILVYNLVRASDGGYKFSIGVGSVHQRQFVVNSNGDREEVERAAERRMKEKMRKWCKGEEARRFSRD